MALPNPLPDNPQRWDGWRNYNSPNFYERLCLDFGSNATDQQIEENCRQLLVWWQKKLPLKNQPSNPIAQMLRAGLDEAPVYLVEARTELLNRESRAKIDAGLHAEAIKQAVEEFKKIISFAIINKRLAADAEERLYVAGAELGLSRSDMEIALNAELERVGGVRAESTPVATPTSDAPRGMAPQASNPFDEFRRVLRLSKLCLDGEDMTDDQRDAMCNMGESLGLTGGQAEDLIDEYLEEMATMPLQPIAPAAVRPARPPVPTPARPAAANPQPKPTAVPARPAAPAPPTAAPAATVQTVVKPVITPLSRAQEKARFPNFVSPTGLEMMLVNSGSFMMGSEDPDAAANEQPLMPVTVTCFYMSKHPVTNDQFELFDPKHRLRRATWADGRHPVVFVSSREAEKFCQWLSIREGKKYRLPTEAEWEFAARGTDNFIYPWGPQLDAGCYANFADKRTSFAWRDPVIDDGFAETAPVGSYPRGASPFGIEDMAGNVFEWCLDFYEDYKARERVNRRGPAIGMKRMYRGGSWKSRATSLRASARNFNAPDYSANDVGFRVVCECDAASAVS